MWRTYVFVTQERIKKSCCKNKEKIEVLIKSILLVDNNIIVIGYRHNAYNLLESSWLFSSTSTATAGPKGNACAQSGLLVAVGIIWMYGILRREITDTYFVYLWPEIFGIPLLSARQDVIWSVFNYVIFSVVTISSCFVPSFITLSTQDVVPPLSNRREPSDSSPDCLLGY